MPNVPCLPESVNRDSKPFPLGDLGWWLLLGDTHIPFHDSPTIELAVEEGKRRGVKGVLLNGDILDCHELSRFDKTPDDPRYTEEVAKGREFMAYMRYKFPKIRIVYKDGNHEERLLKYLISRAPALFGLDVLTLPNILEFKKHGVEYVTDRRVITAGKLHVVHGHEYRPNIQAPVNPARGLFLRAKASAICGHFHQVSEHHEPTISGKAQGCWSTGCACGLSPLYMPLNKWQHGAAMIEIGKGGIFNVDNMRVVDGKLV